jgi:hypothetical protein
VTLPQKGEVPEIGSVWNHPTGKMHPRRTVVSVTVPAGCRVPWVRYRSPTGTAFEDVPLSVWNAWAKRAVRVDDKPRGQ